jgi:hypothetical protein
MELVKTWAKRAFVIASAIYFTLVCAYMTITAFKWVYVNFGQIAAIAYAVFMFAAYSGALSTWIDYIVEKEMEEL